MESDLDTLKGLALRSGFFLVTVTDIIHNAPVPGLVLYRQPGIGETRPTRIGKRRSERAMRQLIIKLAGRGIK